MSTNWLPRRLAAGAFLAAAMLVPNNVLGQQASLSVAGNTADNAIRAEALSEKAASLYASPKRWGEAAALHRKAAELRPAGDLRGVDDLVMAARLLYHLDQLTPARTAMVEAADRALASGELVRAANLYLDAALIARLQSLDGKVLELSRRAELLAASTHLDDGDRSAILRRIATRESTIAEPLSS